MIPLINEQPHIRLLLERLETSGITSEFDIIFVDGGSSDGTDELLVGWCRRKNVRILQRVVGGLSHQIQVGLKEAYSGGYASAITIDGNNKDDPKAIFSVHSELLKGTDLVLCSRFREGGSHSNTPLSRQLLVRLIHAPLVSLVSGVRFTDTTQGMRGWSRRLIGDPSIGLTSRKFSQYRLLPYAIIAAAKSGFRTKEIPNRRSYPPGKVPTKIKSFRAKISLLTDIFWAASVAPGLKKTKNSPL